MEDPTKSTESQPRTPTQELRSWRINLNAPPVPLPPGWRAYTLTDVAAESYDAVVEVALAALALVEWVDEGTGRATRAWQAVTIDYETGELVVPATWTCIVGPTDSIPSLETMRDIERRRQAAAVAESEAA